LSCILTPAGNTAFSRPSCVTGGSGREKGEESRGGSYVPFEKVLEQRVKLEHRHTGEVYRVLIRLAFDLVISTRQREHGAEDGGVEGQKALGDTEKTALDLHLSKE